MSETLAEALPRELARCRELSQEYAAIGPSGVFGKAMIDSEIAAGEKAACEHDTVAMIGAYKRLKECE